MKFDGVLSGLLEGHVGAEKFFELIFQISLPAQKDTNQHSDESGSIQYQKDN
jgi:hypothetical protein